MFRNFKAVPPPPDQDSDLELKDVFAAATTTGHCWVKFVSQPDAIW